MSGLAYLIPAALLLGLLGLGAFLWSVRSGQYDDLDGASWRALFDGDDGAPPPTQPDSTQPAASLYAKEDGEDEGGRRHGVQAEIERS